MQAVCNICSDLFDSTKDVAAIPCGHTFHRSCLDEWTKIQKTCPQCRLKFVGKNIIPKLYFEIAEGEGAEIDVAVLKNEIQTLRTALRVKEKEKNDLLAVNEDLKIRETVLEIQRGQLETELHTTRTERSVLQSQLQFLDQQISETQKAKAETKSLRNKLTELKNLDAILRGSEREADEVLQSYGGKNSVNQPLIAYCSVLKKQLQRTTEQKRQLKLEVDDALRNANDFQRQVCQQDVTIAELQTDLKHSEESQDSLRKKLAALKDSTHSPTTALVGRKSMLDRLVAESPAPRSLSNPSESSDSDNVFHLSLTSSPNISTPRMVPPPKFNFKPGKAQRAGSFKMFMDSRLKRKKLASEAASSAGTSQGESPSLLASPQLAATSRGTGYNGLGGHSKPDVFPRLGLNGHGTSKMSLKRPTKRPALQSRQNCPSQQITLVDLVSPR